MPKTMAAQDWAMLLGLALLFGSAFFFVTLALASVGPLTVALARVGLGGLILGGVAALRRRPAPRDPRIWGALLVMGALNNAIPFALISWSQTHIQSGLAAILNATTPIFAVLAAHAARQERLTLRRLAGVILGFAGVAALIGPAALIGLDPTNFAEVAVLLAAASYAGAGIWGRRLAALPVEVAAAGMLAGGTLLLLPFAVLLEHPWRFHPSSQSLGALGALAACGTAAAYLLYFRLLRRVGPTNLLLVTFLLPVVALALGAVFLAERLQGRELAGLLLILGGLAAIDGRLLRMVRATSPAAGGTSGSLRGCRRS
ncbi:MAG TPA: DMT family transporter [Dongiaceae bacterium]|nr:DMT family transporter [Dongiaceae bacterium]